MLRRRPSLQELFPRWAPILKLVMASAMASWTSLCSVSSMLCSMLQALCSVSSMLCSMPSMLCSMLATLCSMPSTLCSILTIKLINLRFTDNVCLFDLHTWCVYIICLKYIIHSDTWNFATCLRHSHRPWIQVTIPLLCSTPPLQHLCTVP